MTSVPAVAGAVIVAQGLVVDVGVGRGEEGRARALAAAVLRPLGGGLAGGEAVRGARSAVGMVGAVRVVRVAIQRGVTGDGDRGFVTARQGTSCFCCCCHCSCCCSSCCCHGCLATALSPSHHLSFCNCGRNPSSSSTCCCCCCLIRCCCCCWSSATRWLQPLRQRQGHRWNVPC